MRELGLVIEVIALLPKLPIGRMHIYVLALVLYEIVHGQENICVIIVLLCF